MTSQLKTAFKTLLSLYICHSEHRKWITKIFKTHIKRDRGGRWQGCSWKELKRWTACSSSKLFWIPENGVFLCAFITMIWSYVFHSCYGLRNLSFFYFIFCWFWLTFVNMCEYQENLHVGIQFLSFDLMISFKSSHGFSLTCDHAGQGRKRPTSARVPLTRH